MADPFHYIAPDNKEIVSGIRPSTGDLVSVTTFAGKGIIAAEVVGEDKDGYLLKFPSPDGLHAVCKTVPHYWHFKISNKPLTTVAAARFWNAGLQLRSKGIIFKLWDKLPIFINSWGELGLWKLLLIAQPTVDADHDFASRVKMLRDKRLIEKLAEMADSPEVRKAAVRVLAER